MQALPNESFGIVAGDFNHDGKLDVAVIGAYLSVLLGNGDGTFQAAVNYTGIGESISVGDFNGDGNLDLVIGNENNSVSVFLGNGDGTFQPPRSSGTTSGCCAFIAVADFNGDHKMDIVVIDFPHVSVLLGNGDGTFQSPLDVSGDLLVGAHELAVGDFNNDHRRDVALVGYFGGTQYFWILLGNGDGTFQPPLSYPLNYVPGSVATGDFRHDGNLDLAVGAYLGGGVAVLLGNGDGTFQPEVDYSAGEGPVLVGDFNRDGSLDIVAGISLLLGNGDGTFQLAGGYRGDSGGVSGVSDGAEAAGDFNGDGLPDLVYLDNVPDAVTTMLNTGSLYFSPNSPVTFPPQLVGTDSTPAIVTLSNASAKAVSISSIRVSRDFVLGTGTTCSTSVDAGASCVIEVAFQPGSPGRHTGSINLIDGASSKPQIVQLAGSGTIIKISPSSLDFGGQKIRTKSKPQVVTATNESAMTILYNAVSIVGNNREDFAETDNCTGRFIPAGGSCEILVRFDPTKTGARSGLLYVVPQGTGGPQPVPLKGTGT